jgi:hypothetical protein
VGQRSVGSHVALLYFIIPTNNAYWAGIVDSIREDDEAKISIHADYVKKLTYGIPILYVKERVFSNELRWLVNEEKDMRLLVLEADTQSESADPFTTFHMACCTLRYRVPITVVPGN